MQLLLYKLLGQTDRQTHSISLRYNLSLGEEASPNCDHMTGIVYAGFLQIRNSRILKTTYSFQRLTTNFRLFSRYELYF